MSKRVLNTRSYSISYTFFVSFLWRIRPMPIRQLAADVAAKIAAGEVVERPASVVKELIENSIDAGASQIRIDLANGGLQLIRVTDNGCGIPAGELQLALARHATSKVAQIDDLEHIRSLGFRGEALASIAAVAEGTALTVRDLFSAVPARLKFLKSRNTEISHCHHLLEQYALAYPEIRFSVFSEGRQIFSTAGDGQLSSVLVEIYGLQVAEQMVPISSLDGRDGDPERPVVSGYTSLPTCYKSTRQHISFFVNRRWVLSRMLTAALEEAYHSLLLSGRHPIAVVNIALDPTMLDVNVHPAKTEIRFLKERRVYGAVLRAARQALLEEAEMPTWGNARGTYHDTQGAINQAPTADDETTSDNEITSDNADIALNTTVGADLSGTSLNTTVGADLSGTSPIYRPTEDSSSTFPQDNPWITVTEEETGTKPPLLSRLWQSHIRRDDPVTSHDIPGEAPPGPTWDAINRVPTPRENDKSMVAPVARAQDAGGPVVGAFDAAAPEATYQPTDRLPSLRVIGQLSQSYIVAEGPAGMYLV